MDNRKDTPYVYDINNLWQIDTFYLYRKGGSCLCCFHTFYNLIEGYVSQGGKQLVLVEIALSAAWSWVSTAILLKPPYLSPVTSSLIHISINKLFHAQHERWFPHPENTVFLAHTEVNFWPFSSYASFLTNVHWVQVSGKEDAFTSEGSTVCSNSLCTFLIHRTWSFVQ